ncbi:hypothetical protein [Arthrobacter sp. 7Tela_A1]|uniref:hypothetical protein n=1 Tax=Arthrobacter sp. 7Tela_A1 TaxID=3093745 RepID=UPI003BB72F35
MSQILDIRENTVKISMPQAEHIRKVSLSLECMGGVKDKSVAIVVRAWDAEGISVIDSCKGVYFSNALQERFAYCPETPSGEFSKPVNLEFDLPAAEVTFQLFAWPGSEPVPADIFGGSLLFVESSGSAFEYASSRTRILTSEGRKIA